MIDQVKEGVRLKVHIQPQATKSEVVGPHNGALKIRIQAPPVDGKANQTLIEFLAKKLGIPKRQIHLIHGDTSRQKTLLIEGLELEAVQKALL